MIGIVLIGHGNFASELLKVAETMIGKTEKAIAVDFFSRETMADLRTKISNALEFVKSEDGVLIIADMFGGSCSNICCTLVNQDNVQIVTGLNLPMFLSATLSRTKYDLKGLVKYVRDEGKKSVLVLKEIFQRDGKAE